MPAALLDFKMSQPSNTPGAGVLPGGITLPVTLAAAPAVQAVTLADLGLFLNAGPPNRVDLYVEVGVVQTSFALSSITITFIRDGNVIYTGNQDLSGINDQGEQNYLLTFTAGDFDVDPGFHVYTLQISITPEAGSSFNVVGPVTFSGAAYEMTS